MALEDCIRRFGKLLSSADITQLRQWIADGMDETAAVQRLLTNSYRDGVRILGEAQRAGATISAKPQPVAQVIGIQTKILQDIKRDRYRLHQDQAKILQRLAVTSSVDMSLRTSGVNLESDMDIMDELSRRLWAPKPAGEPANLAGLEGRDGLELLASYKALKAEDASLIDLLKTVMDQHEDLDRRVEAIFGSVDEAEAMGLPPKKEFFQGPAQPAKPRLTVHHNLSAENLEVADGLGGLALPSLAIQPEGQVMSGFGDILLIGDEVLGDPKKVPIFDSDAYSVTMPPPEYRKAKQALAQALVNEMRPFAEKYGQPYVGAIDFAWDYSVNTPDPGKIIGEWLRSTVAMGWFLETKGINTEPVVKDVRPRYAASWTEAWLSFLKGADLSAENFSWEDPRRQNLYKRAGNAWKAAMREQLTPVYEAMGLSKKDIEANIADEIAESSHLDEDGRMFFGSWEQLKGDANQKGKTRISDMDTSHFQEDLIRKHRLEREFKDWVEGKVLAMFEPAQLTISGRKVPYTLDNIVRKMRGAKLRGAEKTLTFGPGNARAAVAKRLKSMEALRREAARQIRPEDETKSQREVSEEALNRFRDEVVEYYEFRDWRGNIDMWNALDDSMRAMAYWANNRDSMGSHEALAEGLRRNNFVNVPDQIIRRGTGAVGQWLMNPVPYFEAKPRRAVKLEEFKGAVIRADASPETRAILQRHGIPFKQYPVGEGVDSQTTKRAAVDEFMQQLDQRGERVFFQQSEIGFTSGLVNAAMLIPRDVGTAADMLGSLKKQPGAKAEEIKWVGVEEWLNAKGGKITKDELVEFIRNNGVQVEEHQYGYIPDIATPRTTYHQADEAAYEALEIEYGDFDVVRIWDVQETTQNEWYRVVEDLDAGNVSVQRQEDGEWLTINAPLNQQELRHAEDAISKDVLDRYRYKGPFVGRTEYGGPDLTLGGKRENYREITLNLPVDERSETSTGVVRFPDHDMTGDQRLSAAESAEAFQADVEEELNISGALQFDWAADSMKFTDLPADALAKLTEIIMRREYDGFGYYGDVVKKGAGPSYGGGHIGINTIAWFRVDERVGPNGERMLFVEEVQSDWHQGGKKHGYLPDAGLVKAARARLEKSRAAAQAQLNEVEDILIRFRNIQAKAGGPVNETQAQAYERLKYILSKEKSTVVNDPEWRKWWETSIAGDGQTLTDRFTEVELLMLERWREAELETRHDFDALEKMEGEGDKLPDGPFKGSAWSALAVKRLIRMAAEEGFDQIAWTTGDQQRERNTPAKVVSELRYDPSTEFLYAVGTNGIDANQRVPAAELHKWIGRDAKAALDKQIAEIEEQYEIIPADEALRLEEGFGLDVFVIKGPKGKLIRRGLGTRFQQVVAAPTEAAARQQLYDWLRDNGKLPELIGDGLQIGGHGMDFYDTTLLKNFQRVARGLDPAAKVDFKGGAIETGVEPGQKYRVAESAEGGQFHVIADPQNQIVSGPWTSDLAMAEQMRLTEEHESITTEAVHKMDVTDQMKAEAMKGQTLWQDRRASIHFDSQNRALIRMTQARDLSSFLHEGGHLYLELIADMAEMENASDRHVDDWAKVLKWLGVNSREEITTEHHELFADTFLAYLREGKAPDVNLRDIFTAFQTWLTWVFRRATLEHKLDPEITGVFDRLVASDEAISNAERSQNLVAMFLTQEDSGMSAEAWAVYKRGLEKEHERAVDAEAQKLLAILQREQQTWWDSELEKHLQEVSEEAYDMPVYQALAMLQRGQQPDGSPSEMGPFKINKQSLLDQGYTPAFLKTLPRPWIYTAKKDQGVDVDAAARMFGFGDGAAMLEAMMKAPKIEEFIDAEARKRMGQQHPDPMVDGSLEADAVTAVYSTKRGEILAAELRALRRMVKADKPIVSATKAAERRTEREAREANKAQSPKRAELRAIKAAAAATVAKMKVRDINPTRYQQAAQKAGRLAFEAAARKDYQEAYDQKRRQIIQHETYRAAVRAKDKHDKNRVYLSKFDKPRVRKSLGRSDILAQIDKILSEVSFKRISGVEAQRQTAAEKLRQQIESGEIAATPETLDVLGFTWQAVTDKNGEPTGEHTLLSRPVPQRNWQDLTGLELQGLTDTVKQLEHMAKTEHQAIVMGEEIDLNQAIDEVAASLDENHEPMDATMAGNDVWEEMKRHGNMGINLWLRPSAIARILDNHVWGPFSQRVIVPIRRAYAEKLIPMMDQYQRDLDALYIKHYTPAEIKTLNPSRKSAGDRIFIDAMGEKLTKGERLSLALNWGNEGNRNAVRNGKKWDGEIAYPPAAIQQILDSLDARDWAFVQDVWDYYNEYWPQLSEVERRRRGFAPSKVEATPFTWKTSDGQTVELRGGYAPIKYDPRHSKQHKEDRADDLYKQMGNGNFITSSTRAGSLNERKDNTGMAVRLGLRTIDLHLREIIRDIAIGDEVNAVKRILNDPKVHVAFQKSGNENAQKALNLWLVDAAVGELPAEDIINRAANYLRVGWTVSKIGLNMLTSGLQQTGHIQSMHQIGQKYWSVGLGQAMKNPNGISKFVTDQSALMNSRYNLHTWDKDVLDTMNRMDGLFTASGISRKDRGKWARRYFWPIMKMQQTVDIVTWLGAREQAIEEHGLKGQAIIDFADAAVERAQTSGFFSDRSGIERGTTTSRIRQNQFIRQFTTVISYMLAKAGLYYEKTQKRKQARRQSNEAVATSATKLLGDIFVLFTLEALASAALYNRWPDDEDDFDGPMDWFMWGVGETIGSFMSGIPFVREFQAAKYRGGNTPIGAIGVSSYRAFIQAGQAEVDRPAIKSVFDVAGPLFHLPSNQAYRTGDAIWADIWEGEDVTIYEYLAGRRR